MTGSKSDTGSPSHGDRRTLADEVTTETSDTLSILGHFYRGEMERTVGWRTRLDQTTNWAVVLMAAILTFVFSGEDNPHYVLLIGVLGVVAFLVIESQRYQEYDAWRYRVRLLQRQFFADVTDPGGQSETDWRKRLGEDLRDPSLLIPRWKAVAHRLRRVYILLLTVLIAAWLLRISVFDPDSTWYRTGSIGSIPGTAVVGVVVGLYLVLFALALWSALEGMKREFDEKPVAED